MLLICLKVQSLEILSAMTGQAESVVEVVNLCNHL